MLIIEENPLLDVVVHLPKRPDGKIPSAVFICRVIHEESLPDSVDERFEQLIVGWRDVVDHNAQQIEFSPARLPDLLRQPGFIGHFQQAYHQALIWGTEKNFVGSSTSC